MVSNSNLVVVLVGKRRVDGVQWSPTEVVHSGTGAQCQLAAENWLQIDQLHGGRRAFAKQPGLDGIQAGGRRGALVAELPASGERDRRSVALGGMRVVEEEASKRTPRAHLFQFIGNLFWNCVVFKPSD